MAPRPEAAGEAAAAGIPVGAVGKPFGIRGEVYVFGDPDLGEPFAAGSRYATDRGTDLVVAESRQHQARLLVRFEGVDDRSAAEALRGVQLVRPRADVGIDDDAVWVDDLKGREVVASDGELVGLVEGVVDGPAHDYLVVARPDGGEVLIPYVDALVDDAADPIVVQALPGLYDDDALDA